jgi:hypothetical protein
MNSYMDINREVGSAPEFLSGDWYCPSCGDHQFAQNKECRLCGSHRSKGGKKGGKKGKKGGKKGGKEKGKNWGKGKGKGKREQDYYEEEAESEVKSSPRRSASRSPSRGSSRKEKDELWSIFNWDTMEWGEREEELMELPHSWNGLRTYRNIVNRAKTLVAKMGGDRRNEETLLICPGCLRKLGGVNAKTHVAASETDAESTLMSHLTDASCNEALSKKSSKHKHMKPEMFEQVRATYNFEIYWEEREGPRDGGASSGSRDNGRSRMVRMGSKGSEPKKARKASGRGRTAKEGNY